MLPGYVKTASALALLVVLGAALVKRPASPVMAPANDETGKETQAMTLTLKITGMSCSHCAHSVERGLSECAGVEEAQVDLASGRATVRGDAGVHALVRAVETTGYKASPVEGW